MPVQPKFTTHFFWVAAALSIGAAGTPAQAQQVDLATCPNPLLANCDSLLHRRNLGASVGELIDHTMKLVKSIHQSCENAKTSDQLCEIYYDAVQSVEHPELKRSKRKQHDRNLDLFSECFIKLNQLETFRIRNCSFKQSPQLNVDKDYKIWTPDLDLDIKNKIAKKLIPGSKVTYKNEDPVAVVIHGTGTLDVGSALNSLSPVRSGQSSCHFLVELDGTIHQLVPTDRIAFHAQGLNARSICIENIRLNNPNEAVDPRQIRANRQIIQYLKNRFPHISGVVPHSEYTRYRGTIVWNSNSNAKIKSSDEPGPEFMRQLRAQLNNCETD